MVALIVVVVVVLFALVVAARTIRVIPQARAGVVERLGRYSRTLEPGLAIVTPFVDRVKPLVDLREQVVNFAPQSVISEDNVVVGIETVLYFTITDPRSATYEIANPLQAIEQLTVTTLRNVIGGLTLEATLTARENVNTELRIVLDEATGKWGIRINRVEIKSVDPPADIRTAMEKQMRAERDRRAAILTAEGEKQAQILTAEGEQQAAVLTRRGRAPGGDPARGGRSEGDRHRLQSDPRGSPHPRPAQLRIPADAPPARRRRTPTRCSSIPSEFAQAFGGIGEALAAGVGARRAGVRRVRAVTGTLREPRAAGREPAERQPATRCENHADVRLPRREAAGHPLGGPSAGDPDRAGHRRAPCARSASRCSRRTSTSRSSALHRRGQGALPRRGARRQAEPRPAGREDRRRGSHRPDGRGGRRRARPPCASPRAPPR